MLPTKVLIGFETTYNQLPTGADLKPYQLCLESNGMTYEETQESKNCMGGNRDSGGKPAVTGSKLSGDIKGVMSYEQIGVSLKAAFGDPITTDNGNGTYTHEFDTTTSCLPSYFIQNTSKDGGCAGEATTEFIQQFTGVRASKFSTTISGSGIAEFTLSAEGSSYKDSQKGGAVAVDESNIIMPSHTQLNMNTASVSIDGSTFAKMSEFGISIDNGIEATDLIGGTKDVSAMKADVVGTVKAIWDTPLYTKIANGAKVSFLARFTDGTNVLDFINSEAVFSFKSPPVTVNEKVMIDSEYTAFTESGTERMKIVLTNTIAAY